MTDTQKDLLLFGGLALIGVILVSQLGKLGSTAAKAIKCAVCKDVVQPVSCALAKGYEAIACCTQCEPAGKLSGDVTLPNGQTISANCMRCTSFCCAAGQAYFCYGGQEYTIPQGTGCSCKGTYNAQYACG